MNKVRCAIYTRKSSEEGLEQDFNSLDAQREACAAYVQSQASEGWSLLDNDYDDGGLSGGTMRRPALQRLLKDIRLGKIDIVVVYKVDRLTRSLLDFSRLVEAFDKAEVSFVSVTQSFNTTTSMGRLTLNMLLSFAQFEREVTAERIRDKIAASKARGMWMGGIPPLGYEPDGRTLRIIEGHAAVVRDIFERYRSLGNVRLVFEQLRSEGTRVPERTLTTGRTIGGGQFTRGQIYKLLSNPIYAGEIHHGDKVHKGKHEPIIDRDLWTTVQACLGENRQGEQRARTIRSASLLAGKVFDDKGEPLVASHACKGKVRYRYYVSRSLQHAKESAPNGWRIPARELEGAVMQRITQVLEQPLELLDQTGTQIRAGSLARLDERATELAQLVCKNRASSIRPLVERVVVAPDRLTVILDGPALLASFGIAQSGEVRNPELRLEVRLKRTGLAVKLVQSDGRSGTRQVDETLVKLIQRARSWWEELATDGKTMAQFARERELNTSYVSRTVRLAFLSPQIVEAIAEGNQPALLTADRLRRVELPIHWSDQCQMFGL